MGLWQRSCDDESKLDTRIVVATQSLEAAKKEHALHFRHTSDAERLALLKSSIQSLKSEIWIADPSRVVALRDEIMEKRQVLAELRSQQQDQHVNMDSDNGGTKNDDK